VRKTGKFNIIILASLMFLGVFGVSRALTMQEIIIGQQGRVLGASTNGLVGYWNFDEGSGTTAADSSGNGNTGTLTNGPTWTTGKVGSGALGFDGVDDYVSASGISLPSGFTYSLWINPSQSSVLKTIIRQGGVSTFLRTWSNNQIQFGVYCSGGVVGVVAGTVTSNIWSHVAVSWNGQCGTGGSVTIFINGTPTAFTGFGSGNPPAAVTTLSIGNSFSGLIDDVRVYNRVLSAQEVLDIYNDGGSPPTGDTTAPSIPPGLTATAFSSSAVNLSWTASTDSVGVTGYKVYRDGSQIATTANTSYSDSNLSANTAYSYSVSAYDAAGNNSSQSASASATTQPTAPPPPTTHTYWVSPTGAASWANCKSDAPLDGIAACPLNTANTNAAAGDTVYLRGGTYPFATLYAIAVHPTKSGTPDSWITFKNAPGESPELKGTYGTRMWGIQIQNVSYIKIDGLIFSDFSDSALMDAFAHHIEVMSSTFRNVTSPYRDGGFGIYPGCYGGSSANCPTHDIWVHNNTFSKLEAGGGCNNGLISEGGDSLRIGYASSTLGGALEDSHITIENNYIAYGGHTLFDSYGTKVVFKNNILHNEPWYPADTGTCTVNWPATGYTNPAYDGLYGHRVFAMTDTFNNPNKNNLVEGNRFGYGSVNPNNDGAEAADLAVSGSIFRYNFLFGAMNSGFMFKYGDYTYYGWQATGGNFDSVYNNTIYKNGYGYPYYNTCHLSTCPEPEFGIRWYAAVGEKNNAVKNNIVYGNRSAVEKGKLDIQDNSSGNDISNNWVTPNGDPKFVNPDLTDTASRVLPDLSLQSNSPAINGGTYLAQAIGSGSNFTSLSVNDAQYFQDGTWGASMARGVTFFPDWIAVGNANNVAEITSIDYLTNTITLKSPISWSANDPVWLFKDSSGRQVLYGSAPDYGASEYAGGGSSDTTPPSPPTGVNVQ
jgi:hypothetical protein